MTANKKRRKLPEENLAAAVAEMINSPITRSNLSFLRPLPPAEEPSPAPAGLETEPLGDDITPSGSLSLWRAEGIGAIFEQARVRPIREAQEALSPVERRVYDLLWGTSGGDEFRLVHYSLQRIATEAGLNIKTVRELLPRLIGKGFLQIEHEADVRRNLPTLYRVLGFATVHAGQQRRNRLYIAKTGKGVFYVHPVSAQIEATAANVTPMGVSPKPPAYALSPAAVESTPSLRTALSEAIHSAVGVAPADDVLTGLIAACHQNAIETTGQPAWEEELIYFTATKAQALARAPNIRNHLAVLRRTVPECFLGEPFRAYRAAKNR